MPKLTSGEIRQQFLDFFAGKEHTIVPSASLIPHDDPTLLFTNAGMNQFKDVFLGIGSRSYTRAADTQKCMRVSGKHNDLEEVGKSPYHHTFFEMLGNWSFGDYYKKEAIQWAWELLTGWWGLPKEHLHATVFEDDKGDLGRDTETADYWAQVTDIVPEHVLCFGRKDNFWEMGDTGPCGPCSEIHLDRGARFCDMDGAAGHVCQVNGDCHRFVELWNLVFIQYNRHADGSLDLLPAKHVDTGLGFGRVVTVLQGVASNYDTDLFCGILERVQEMLGHGDAERRANQVGYRVVADHGRAAAFLIADGALPGNVGRSYVLRMIIRRAARFGRQLGFAAPFLAQVADVVIEEMGSFFTELDERREHIQRTLTAEEERFQRTLDAALARLDDVLAGVAADGKDTVDGETAFDLYATYGLPLEITRDAAQERGCAVDETGFRAASEAHKVASGAGIIGTIDSDELGRYADLVETLTAGGLLAPEGVDHDPYGDPVLETQLVAVLRGDRPAERVGPGDEVEAVLAATPFYVESGGQVSDTGVIEGAADPGWQIEVVDVHLPVAGLIVHRGRVVSGRPRPGDPAVVSVSSERRQDIRRNHTATHLLHKELRSVLGDHVLQQGSLVAPDRLRFDFNHPAMLGPEELGTIEQNVNQAILRNYPVAIGHTSLEGARNRGAMALFGEKYGEVVRTVQVGGRDEPYSFELCGGTHVKETAEIGFFHIFSEGSVGANLRRIEAVTGRRAQAVAQEGLGVLERVASHLNVSPGEVDQKVQALLGETQEAQREIARLQRALARQRFERLLQSDVREVDGIPVMAAVVDGFPVETLREMADWFRDRVGSGVAALGTVAGDRPLIIVAVSPDLAERGLRADQLIREAAALVGGGGGGSPTLARAGGRDPDRLPEAVARVPQAVAEAVSG